MESNRDRAPLTIDIVIPTIHPDKVRPISPPKMAVPSTVRVHYYIVVDRPAGKLSIPEESSVDVTEIRNDRNYGGHYSRNQGFEAGSGQYVLFMDDDVEPASNLLESYVQSIREHPDAPGLVGTTRFPPAKNSFTAGIWTSDILTFFDLAKTRDRMAWGVTANLLVKREAVGNIRFSTRFPKWGGGEDIDFCLKIVERSGHWLKTVPEAAVDHPWWFDGRRRYRRFMRWAYGDSSLPVLHPSYRFRNFPNLVETIFVVTILAVAAVAMGFRMPSKVLWWGLGVVGLEFLTEGIRIALHKGKVSPLVIVEAHLIRLSNDLGRLGGNLRRLHLQGLTERFDYFATRESIPYERKVGLGKFLTNICFALILYIAF